MNEKTYVSKAAFKKVMSGDPKNWEALQAAGVCTWASYTVWTMKMGRMGFPCLHCDPSKNAISRYAFRLTCPLPGGYGQSIIGFNIFEADPSKLAGMIIKLEEERGFQSSTWDGEKFTLSPVWSQSPYFKRRSGR